MTKKQNKKEIKAKSKGINSTTGKGKKHIYSGCKQKHCGYLLNGGCQKCQECGAEPKMIDEGCQTCFDCEYKPGCLRWGDKGQDTTNQNKLFIPNKDIQKDIAEAIMKAIKQKQNRKILIGNDGEPLTANQEDDGNNPFSPKELEKELKQELVKQMVAQMMSQAGQQQDFNDGDCKGCSDCSNEKDDEGQPVKKKEVTYIG